jgi:hypothetical protein
MPDIVAEDPAVAVAGEAKPEPVVALSDGSLGPNSRIDELKARLLQLGGPGFGKKQVLWTDW